MAKKKPKKPARINGRASGAPASPTVHPPATATALSVRVATLADLTALRLIYQEFIEAHALPYPDFRNDESHTAFTLALADRLTREDPTLCAIMAFDGSTPIGFLLADFCTRQIGFPTRFVVVHWLYVAASYRGEGIGRKLSALALAHAQAWGAETAELGAKPGDGQWAARGWVPVSTVYALPLNAVAASFVSRRVPNGAASHAED